MNQDNQSISFDIPLWIDEKIPSQQEMIANLAGFLHDEKVQCLPTYRLSDAGRTVEVMEILIVPLRKKRVIASIDATASFEHYGVGKELFDSTRRILISLLNLLDDVLKIPRTIPNKEERWKLNQIRTYREMH